MRPLRKPGCRLSATVLTCLLTTVASAQLKVSPPQQLSTVSGNPSIPPDGDSGQVALGPDSDYAVFSSRASNLLGDGKDTNNAADVFLRKRGSSTVTRLSVTTNGEEAQASSPRFDDEDMLYPAISSLLDDRKTFGVTFASRATNLLPDGVTNPDVNKQLYLRIPDPNNPARGTTVLISRGFSGTEAGNGNSTKSSITALEGKNGFRIVFSSSATNLVAAPQALGENPPSARLAGPSRLYIADVTVSRSKATVMIYGIQEIADAIAEENFEEFYDPVISGDGQYVACTASSAVTQPFSTTPPVTQILRLNLKSKIGETVSKNTGGLGQGSSKYPSISYAGDKITFSTEATNLGVDASASQPKFVLWRDVDDSLELIGKTGKGVVGNGSYPPQNSPFEPHGPIGMISIDGRFAAWSDTANNLVSGDTNGVADVFLKDLSDNSIKLVSRTEAGGPLDAQSVFPAIGKSSLTGGELRVAFETRASGIGTFFFNPSTQSNTARVFISTGSFSEQVIEKNAPIDTPPDVKVSGRTVTLTLLKFRLPRIKKFELAPTSLTEESYPTEHASKATVSYEIQLARAGTKKRIKINATKNRVTIRALPPGTYEVTYRAISKLKNKVLSATKFSPKRKFVIKK